jgi:Flp pilus assembly pilin Flp
MPGRRSETGAASVEQVGLAMLVAFAMLAAIAAVAAGGDTDSGRALAGALGRKIACAPRLPEPCRHHPLVPAYGWPLARLVRAMAPAPAARPGATGMPLAPVDFRRCRQESCAVASSLHLTASGRRPTAFTEVDDERRTLGWVQVTYWLYRPGLPWERIVRRATQADVEAASGTPVLLKDDPMLVPLETLPGRDYYDFPAGEEPPWRWRIRSRYPGWSS